MYLIFTHRFACKKGYKFNLFFVLTERLTIYEECDVDMQCNGTYVGGVCKKIGHRKLCSVGCLHRKFVQTFIRPWNKF